MLGSVKLCITEGDYVILQRGLVNQLFKIIERKPVYFCKQKIFLSNLVGKPYGSLFQLKGKDLHEVQESTPNVTTVQGESFSKDNRSLNDDGTSQQLTKEEIETLKSEGASSETIVKSLIENSLTFNSKTQFSQEKYVRKKKEKYVDNIRVLKTSVRLLVEIYHKHGPPKICNLRSDTLSQMLTSVNVMAGGSYLVVDSCLGLLVTTVLEKILPGGKVIQLYTEPGPVSSYRHAVDSMNYSKEDLLNALFGMSYLNLCSGNDKQKASVDDAGQDENGVLKDEDNDYSEEPTAVEANVMSVDVEEQNESEDKTNSFMEKKKAKQNRKELRKKEREEAMKLLSTRNLDGLLMCCRCPPGPLAMDLLDYLAPSRPFAIHSMTFQPLVEAYDQIKSSNKAIFLKISETWLRKYQVLPDRTHPEINMSNTGGYLLTGIRVEPVCR